MALLRALRAHSPDERSFVVVAVCKPLSLGIFLETSAKPSMPPLLQAYDYSRDFSNDTKMVRPSSTIWKMRTLPVYSLHLKRTGESYMVDCSIIDFVQDTGCGKLVT
tara:strand:- start:110 stop:430 length:321 start_codon:yes stop_codon:yes gene_type:complete